VPFVTRLTRMNAKRHLTVRIHISFQVTSPTSL
jgi:hypothetical protein